MMATLAGPAAAAAAEAGTGALGIGVAGAALLAWARAVAPNPDARMHTNVNERFMRFYNSLVSPIEIARAVAEAYLASWSISCALLRRFFGLEAENAEKRHGQRTFTGTTQIIGGRPAQVNAKKAKIAYFGLLAVRRWCSRSGERSC